MRKLSKPWTIQQFVSKMPYNAGDDYKSAEQAIAVGTAHCMEGALVAAWALEKLGHEPRLLHFRAHRDDDHVVAVFRERTGWGAIGKSNTTLLTWRPPIYANPESLALSYFPFYFNTRGQMSLQAWAGPVRLRKYERQWDWRRSKEDFRDLSSSFYDRESERQIFSARELNRLPLADPRLVEACFLGANRKGLWKA